MKVSGSGRLDQYREFGEQYDMEFLDAIKSRSKFNIIHNCGSNIFFDLLASYPVEAVSWDASLPGNPDLAEGKLAKLRASAVNMRALAEVARRHETQAGRRLVLLARVPDRPGGLSTLLALVAEQRANLLDVQHIREGIDLHVRETAVQLVLETRSREHAEQVTSAIRRAGYADTRVSR